MYYAMIIMICLSLVGTLNAHRGPPMQRNLLNLSVPDCLKKTVYRNQIGEIHENRKGPLTLVGGGMKRNCKNNCPLKNCSF